MGPLMKLNVQNKSQKVPKKKQNKKKQKPKAEKQNKFGRYKEHMEVARPVGGKQTRLKERRAHK